MILATVADRNYRTMNGRGRAHYKNDISEECKIIMKMSSSPFLKRMLSIAVLILALHASGLLHAEDRVPVSLSLILPTVLALDPVTAETVAIPEPAIAIPDRKGIISDTRNFLLFQVAFTGFLYVAPESISNWSDEQKQKDRFESWKDNVSRIVWDTDDWTVNYIGHPYFGAAYYIRARERGYDQTAAFWYSALLSTTYEFGIEAMFENPSIQDLIVTPLAGTALGYYFDDLRARIRSDAKQSGWLSAGDKFLLNLTDPLGYLNQYVDGWFGPDIEVEIAPYLRLDPDSRVGTGNNHSSAYGLVLNLRF